MRRVLMVLAVMALAVPAASSAQVSLGLRVGYAPAMGDAAKDSMTGVAEKMSDGMKSQIPIQLDALYRVNKDVGVGAYFSYGIGQVGGSAKEACDAYGLSCSASDMRLGIQATYSLNQVNPQFVPWLGLGFGYEWGKMKMSGGGIPEFSYTYKGFELLNLQVGGDYKVNEQFAVGPYVMFSIAQYSSAEVESQGVTVSGSFSDIGLDKTIHEWLGFGIRGKFDL